MMRLGALTVGAFGGLLKNIEDSCDHPQCIDHCEARRAFLMGALML